MTRHFTLDEANSHLRIIEPVLRDAVRLKREHDTLLLRLSTAAKDDDTPEAESRADDLRAQIRERADFITALGIQIKNLDHGLIDFPTMRDGEEVLLCWHLEEPAVRFWHTYEDRFPGRRLV